MVRTRKFVTILDKLEQEYKKMINIPSRNEFYKQKVASVIYFSQLIKKGQQLYLENDDRSIKTQEIIEFDYYISEWAKKGESLAEYLLEKYVDNYAKRNEITSLDNEIISFLFDSRNTMLYVSARWFILQNMKVFDIDREKKKQKVPKRFALLEEPAFCYDRVLATALGITFEDGFMPNRGVVCLAPSGGKTFLANKYTELMLSHFWIRFGETGLIRMTNTAMNAQTYGKQCMNSMESDAYLKIFPEFKKYVNAKGKLDIFSNRSAEKCLLRDCTQECNDSIFMFGRDAEINGKRAMLGAVLDDLTGGMNDMDNDDLHKSVTDKVMGDVDDRNDDDSSPILVQGTMFNENDTQNTLINMWEKQGLSQYKVSRYIKVTEDGKKFTCLVDIEDEKGHSIAPELHSDEKLQTKKDYYATRGKSYVYNLIYRQHRDSKQPKTFDLSTLRLYDFNKKNKNLDKYAYTMIDTTRRSGKNYFAMPIFRVDLVTGLHRWVDLIFVQKSLGIVDDPKNIFASEICKKIIKSNITECCIENNTSNTTGALLKGICHSQKYDSCKFRERYTSKRGVSSSKVVRILNMEETIKNYIEIPDPNTVPNDSPFKIAINQLTNWNSTMGQTEKNPDDICDVLAMYCEEFIFKKNNKGKIKSFQFFM